MKTKIIIIIAAAIAVIVACALFFFSNETDPEADDQKSGSQTANVNQTIENEDSSNFSGTVLDAQTNQPLAAKIIVKDDERIVKTTECNASGEYSLSLNDGEYQIAAEYPGYVARGKFDVFHPIEIDGDPDASENILLWPEAQIKGRIVSEDEGVRADLRFFYQYDNSDAETYTFQNISTDEAGKFLLKGAYGGVLDIEITAENFVTQKLTDIELEPGKTVDLGVIPMKAGVTVYGIVTDTATDKAIAGADLKYIDRNGKVLMQTTSQEDGSYQLPATDMKNIRIAVTADGYKNIYDTITPHDQRRYEYNIGMTKLTGIGLVVSNQTGRDPIKTMVTVTDIASEKVVHELEYENGYYSLEDLTGGPYLVRGVSADKLTEATARAITGTTTTLTLKPFARLNVQFVMKRDNSPAKGFYRYIYKPDDGEEMTTNWTPIPDDTALIDNLMPGTYIIEARPDSFWEKTDEHPGEEHISRSGVIPLEMGETRFVKLVLTTGGTLRGKLILPPRLSKKAVGAMIYRYDGDDKHKSFWAADASLSENGDFTADQLPEGEFGMYVFTSDGDVGAFTGMKVDLNGDLSMDLDMTHARKETESGVSLQIPRPSWTDEEWDQMSKEEQDKKTSEAMKKLREWMKAMEEQNKYQSAAQNRAGEMMNNIEE